MKKILKYIKRSDLWRPIVYKSFIRMMIILVVAFAWEKYIDGGLRGIGFAFQTLGLIVAALGWFAYLRIEGILLDISIWYNKLRKKKKESEKKDMADHIEDEVGADQDLDSEEKGYTSLMAYEITGILFFVVGLFF